AECSGLPSSSRCSRTPGTSVLLRRSATALHWRSAPPPVCRLLLQLQACGCLAPPSRLQAWPPSCSVSNRRTNRRSKMTASTVPHPPVVSRKQWLFERKKLLAHEKELTKHRDRVNAERRWLPMV